MNHKKTKVTVKYRLELWAEWVVRMQTAGLGYPSKNILARLKEGGGYIIMPTGEYHYPEHPYEEEVNAIIQDLSRRRSLLADVLKQEYLRNLPRKEKANAVQLKLTRYRHYLQVAETWVEAKLTSDEMQP